MPTLHFKFTLQHHQGFPPASVVIAVDLNRNKTAEAGEIVTLDRKKLVWEGKTTFAKPKSVDGLLVMLSFNANIGVDFKFAVRLDGPEGKLLFEDTEPVGRFPETRFLRLKAA